MIKELKSAIKQLTAVEKQLAPLTVKKQGRDLFLNPIRVSRRRAETVLGRIEVLTAVKKGILD